MDIAKSINSMTVYFSHFHRLYVAQQVRHGYLYTGRGATIEDAIEHCFRALTRYN